MTSTMYDVIMDLPLFQGISREQVSAFLYKTHIEFTNYEDGVQIKAAGTPSDGLLYILTGTVEVEWQNKSGDISISFIAKPKELLGASNLFGMHRKQPYTFRAKGNVSLMKVSKDQYMTLLLQHNQPVYILNYLNYLSLRAQKPYSLIGELKDMRPLSLLKLWVCTVTPSNAEGIKVHISSKTFCKYANSDEERLKRTLFALQRRGVIDLGMETIVIPSRSKLAKSR